MVASILHDVQKGFDEREPLLRWNVDVIVRSRGPFRRGQILLIRWIIVAPN